MAFKNFLYVFFSLNFFLGLVTTNTFEPNIKFHGQSETGQTFESNWTDNDWAGKGCPSTGNFTIVIHPLMKSCTADPMPDIRNKFVEERGGCVLCMDYTYYTAASAYDIANNFEEFSYVLTMKLQQFEDAGFDPSRGFLYGAGYGANTAFLGAYQYGPGKIPRIDTCQPIGLPYFTNSSILHAKEASQNTQCVHTDQVTGTNEQYCHQDWLMGTCGQYQDAAATLGGSHDTCQWFYLSAFDNDFSSVPNPANCQINETDEAPVRPDVMGFRFNWEDPVYGILYAKTVAEEPWNAPLATTTEASTTTEVSTTTETTETQTETQTVQTTTMKPAPKKCCLCRCKLFGELFSIL